MSESDVAYRDKVRAIRAAKRLRRRQHFRSDGQPKRVFESVEQAQGVLALMRLEDRESMCVYACARCGQLHIGRTPTAAVSTGALG